MKNIFTTIAAVLTVLILAPATVSAQEKKFTKRITVETVQDGKKIVTDTTIVLDEPEEFFIETKDGSVIQGMRTPQPMPGMKGMKGMKGQKDVMIMNRMAPMPPEREGVNYHISIDGVTVNIRAPKEKSKEADRILAEVKKILEAK